MEPFSGGDNFGRTEIASQFAVMQTDGLLVADKSNLGKENGIRWFISGGVCHDPYIRSQTSFFLNMY